MAFDTDRMPQSDIDWAEQNIPGFKVVRVTEHADPGVPTLITGFVDKPKPTKQRGIMNGLEAAFDRDCQVPHFYEAVKFVLAGNCIYTPDFMVIPPTGRAAFVEMKGPWYVKDSRLRLKVVADKYQCWDWYLVKRGSQGHWQVFPVLPTGIKRKPVAVDWLHDGRM
jgi:hypothetical protein